jgi:hypothetical protein
MASDTITAADVAWNGMSFVAKGINWISVVWPLNH